MTRIGAKGEGLRARRPWLPALVLLIVFQIFLSGCGGPPSRLWLQSAGWSRATFLGNTMVGDPVPMAVADDGRIFALLFSQAEADGQQPELLSVEENGEIAWRTLLPVDVGRAESPKVLLKEDVLHLFWLDQDDLFYAQADPSDGTLLGDPAELSGGRLIGHFDAVLDGQGRLVVWLAGPRRQPGLYRLPALDQDPVLVDPRGIRPDLSIGSDGRAHAVWANYPSGFGDLEFFYAPVPDDGASLLESVQPALVSNPRIGPTSVLQGPVGAVAEDSGYLFWTVIERTGMSAGSASTRYVVFDPSAPQLQEQNETLFVPGGYRLPYEGLPAGQFAVGPRVQVPDGGLAGTSYVADVAISTHPSGELALAASARAEYLRNKHEIQVGVSYLQQGQPPSYQLLSFTPSASVLPGLEQGPGDSLYLTWMERGELPGFLVYLTSTYPPMKQGLSELNQEDVARLTADTAFGMLTGMLIAPVATLIALVVPLVIVGLTAFFRDEDDPFLAPATILSLALSLGVYWTVKLGVMPTIFEYIPFSAWLPIIPPWLEDPLRLGVPILIGLLGFLVAWGTTYRRQVRSSIYFVLIYAAVDGLLTGAVYGLHFYAAF